MPGDPNRIQAVFLLAVDATDAAARAQVLNRECGADAGLRQRVEALLAAHDASGGFLDRPPVSPFSTVDEPRLSEGPGGRIGPYKLLQQIGEGGMGVVFLAEQLEPVQRKVALKVIKPGMDTHQVVARFEADRQALALMDHPNIAKVLDAGATDSGRPYFVMELVKGLPITKYADQEHLTPQERLHLFVPICHAVQHAHQKGIIHRDLKPSNILIALYDGVPVPKVIDFGVAKATGTKLTERTLFTEVGHAIGTWEYMAPEQAELNNLDIDTRADIYALGATLYELLAGSPPFTRQQLRKAAFDDMLRMIREVEPPRPSTRLSSSDELPSLAAKRKLEPAKLSRLVRGDLDWIVMKCLEKERGRRYETANGLAMDVQRYLADEPVLASPPSAAYRFRKFARRHKAQLFTASLIALVLLLGAGSIVWGAWNRAERSLQAKQNQLTAEASLARLDDLYKAYQWKEALALVDQAEGLVGPAGDPDLRERIAQAKRKTKLLHGLDNARLVMAASVEGHYNYAGAAAEYRAAFADYGLDVQAGQTEALAERIRAEAPAVREALLVGLDDWAHCVRRALKAELRALAEAADADPWRQRFRRAVAAGDGAALSRLAEEGQRLSLPASSLELLAVALEANNRHAEAIVLLRWARGRHPANFWLAQHLGHGLEAKGAEPADLEERIGCCRVAVALRPEASAAHNNLGVALHAKGQWDDAIAGYKKAIELDPTFAPAYINLGVALADKGQRDDAIAAYKKAIELDPKSAVAHFNLAIVLHDKGQRDEAIAACKKAIELDPKDSKAHGHLGVALNAKGQRDDAIAAFKKAIELEPKYAEAHCNLGIALDAKGQQDDAIAAYKKAIELEPKYARAHYGVGVALSAKAQWDDAIAAYKKAIEFDPKFAMAHFGLGYAREATGQWDDAIAAYKKAIEFNPKDVKVFMNLGNALKAKGQQDDATAAYKKAIELDPSYAEVRCNLGHLLRDQGQLAASLEELRKGHELGSKQPGWRYPSARWVKDGEQLVAVAGKLGAVLEGKEMPADDAERLALGQLCRQPYKELYAASARFYAEAFAHDAKLADDIQLEHRYNGACSAALAAAGKGIDTKKLDDTERSRLRRQALEWLRADLAHWDGKAASSKRADRTLAQKTLKHWQEDSDLTALRDKNALAKLPAQERSAWEKHWAKVAAVLKKAGEVK